MLNSRPRHENDAAFVYVWRGVFHFGGPYSDTNPPWPCPWCGCNEMFQYTGWQEDCSDTFFRYRQCMLCGWAWVAQDNELSLTQKVTELKQFDLNSPNLPLDELG